MRAALCGRPTCLYLRMHVRVTKIYQPTSLAAWDDTNKEIEKREGRVMRKLVLFSVLLVAASSTMLWISGCGRAEAKGKLQIIYTGNIRGSVAPCGCKVSKGGVARLAAFMNRHHDSDANWLTVDAGNYVDRAGGTGGCTSKCQFMIDSYADLHYDVLNIGKQEVWMGKETLAKVMDTTACEFVSANLVDIKSGKPFAEPYVIKDYGNMKVGIMGVLNELDFPAGSSMLDSTAFKVTPSYEAIKKHVNVLKKKADVVVLLCELPSAALDTLCLQIPGIDFVISTGALKSGEMAYTVGKTQIVGTGSSGYTGHSTTFVLNPAWGDSVGVTHFNDQLTDAYDQPGMWTDRLAAFNANPNQTQMPSGNPAGNVAPMKLSPGVPGSSPVSPSSSDKSGTSTHTG